MNLKLQRNTPSHTLQSSGESYYRKTLLTPSGVHQVRDDAEVALEKRLAARGGRGRQVPDALFQQAVRLRIHRKVKRSISSQQADGEPCHRLREPQHPEFVHILLIKRPVQ